jgi:sugar phosphate isomerase/epimerase
MRRHTDAAYDSKTRGAPWRVGTTSYIRPADILPNVEFLAPLVDDVELLLFESDEISSLPSTETVQALSHLGQSHRLSYTVHLPVDAHLGATDEPMRRAAVGKCLRAIERTAPLDPFAWIVHFEQNESKRGDAAHALSAWRAALRRSMGELLAGGLPARRFCVETLAYPFDLVGDIVEELDLSVCLDVGHLVAHGFDVEAALRRYGPRTRVIHLHGVEAGKDHKDISHLDPAILRMLLSAARADPKAARVLTLEVFSEPDLLESLSVLKKLVQP